MQVAPPPPIILSRYFQTASNQHACKSSIEYIGHDLDTKSLVLSNVIASYVRCDMHLAASLRGSLSADVVEALIGAIFIDQGYAKARDFTEWLMDDAAKMRAAVLDLNFKVTSTHTLCTLQKVIPSCMAEYILNLGATKLYFGLTIIVIKPTCLQGCPPLYSFGTLDRSRRLCLLGAVLTQLCACVLQSQLLEFCNVQNLQPPVFKSQRASSPFGDKVPLFYISLEWRP